MKGKMKKIAENIENFFSSFKLENLSLTEFEKDINRLYRKPERELNEIALATGMGQEELNNFINNLVRMGAGDAVTVMALMKEVISKIGNTLSFKDPKVLNATFGAMMKVTEHTGGEMLKDWVSGKLLPTLDKITNVAKINPMQAVNLLDRAVSGTIGVVEDVKFISPITGEEVPIYKVMRMGDGAVYNSETGEKLYEKIVQVDNGEAQEELLNLSQSILAQGSQGYKDYLGLEGDIYKNTMDMTQQMRNTMTPLTLRPDEQQKIHALSERELAALNQRKLNVLLGLEEGIAPSIFKGIEDAGEILEFAEKYAPQAGEVAGIPAQGLTTIQEVIQPSYYLNPERSLTQNLPRAASNKKGNFRIVESKSKKKGNLKISQIALPRYEKTTIVNNMPAYETVQDPTRPQGYQNPFEPPGSGVKAWKRDVLQSDISADAAAQARKLELVRMKGQELQGLAAQIKLKSEIYEFQISQFKAGLEKNFDPKQLSGVADEYLIEKIRPMLNDLEETYVVLLEVYEELMDRIDAELNLALQGNRDLMFGTIEQIKARKDELTKDMVETSKKLEILIETTGGIENKMKQELQQAIVTEPLSSLNQLYQNELGSTSVAGELAASQAIEGKHLWDAAESTKNPAARAKLRQQAIEKNQQALQNLNRSSRSGISDTSDKLEHIGN